MPARADDLLLECLEQIALHVRLRETVDDGHPVDLFVVLRLHVLSGEILEDGRPHLDPIAVRERLLASDLLVVDVGTVGRTVVHGEPDRGALLEVRVAARHRIAVENDVILGTTSHAHGARVEHEPLAEQRWLFGVDHDEAVPPLRAAFTRDGCLHDGGDACFLFRFRQACPSVAPFSALPWKGFSHATWYERLMVRSSL